MLNHLRTCGISLGHLECISSESCTAFQLLLFELFGEYPDSKDLAGVVIDRGNKNLLDKVYIILLQHVMSSPM